MKFFKKKKIFSPEEGEQLLSRLRKALSSEPKFENRKIEFSTRFKEDLNFDYFDSSDSIGAAEALEKEFNIEISDEAAGNFLTIEDVIEYIYRILRQGDAQEGTT
ncbi:MAG: hypothetical protein WC318_04630 [Candidatus Omnitrophota bacterium]|jgi:acyl carrier protein